MGVETERYAMEGRFLDTLCFTFFTSLGMRHDICRLVLSLTCVQGRRRHHHHGGARPGHEDIRLEPHRGRAAGAGHVTVIAA